MPFRLHLETTPTPIAPETGAHKAHQRAPTGSTHQVSQRGEFLFPASRAHVRGKPTTTFNGWPKYKEAFDKLCGVTDWTLHDLRRTLTNLAALKVPPHVVERLLNHKFGSLQNQTVQRQFRWPVDDD